MNTGIIASRYSKALLTLVDQTGNGEEVVGQVARIQAALDSVPELRKAVCDTSSVSAGQKMSLFKACLCLKDKDGNEEPVRMAPELEKFIALLVRNGRIPEVRLVFNSFIQAWYRSRRIKRGRLVVPEYSESTPELEKRLRELIESRTGFSLQLSTEVDPAIIGGFVFEVDDLLLDASVSHQLDLIRRQFVARNRRIV